MSKSFDDYVDKVASFLCTTDEELDAKIRIDNIDDLLGLDLSYYKNGALVICTEDGLVYQYLASNMSWDRYGKWRPYNSFNNHDPELVGTITNDTKILPMTRPNGDKLQILDYCYVDKNVDVPKTIGDMTILNNDDILIYYGSHWSVSHPSLTTQSIQTTSKDESMTGEASNQYQVNLEQTKYSYNIDCGTW